MNKISVNVQLLGIAIILIELIFPYGLFLICGLVLNLIGFMLALKK